MPLVAFRRRNGDGRGKMEFLNLAPGAETVLTAAFKKFTPKPGAEYDLRMFPSR